MCTSRYTFKKSLVKVFGSCDMVFHFDSIVLKISLPPKSYYIYICYAKIVIIYFNRQFVSSFSVFI